MDTNQQPWPLSPQMIEEAAREDERRQRAAAEARQRLDQERREKHEELRDKLLGELQAETPPTAASERLALKLAATEGAFAERVGELQLLLANRMTEPMGNAKATLALVRALRELTQVRALTTKRTQELLQCAANLRTQRAFTVRGLA